MTQYAELQGRPVWVPVAPSGHGSDTTYHLREDCSSTEVRKIGLGQLNGTHKLCKYCADWSDEHDYELPAAGSGPGITCPKCGERYNNAPLHIRNCDGGDDS